MSLYFVKPIGEKQYSAWGIQCPRQKSFHTGHSISMSEVLCFSTGSQKSIILLFRVLAKTVHDMKDLPPLTINYYLQLKDKIEKKNRKKHFNYDVEAFDQTLPTKRNTHKLKKKTPEKNPVKIHCDLGNTAIADNKRP